MIEARMSTLASVNLFAHDLDGQVAFYAELFGLAELTQQRSRIFRALDGGGVALAFNGIEAYSLLNLDHFPPPTGTSFMLTFEVDDPAAVARLADQAMRRGAVIVKPPYDTAYGSRQAVLRDPESNVFRINAFLPEAAAR